MLFPPTEGAVSEAPVEAVQTFLLLFICITTNHICIMLPSGQFQRCQTNNEQPSCVLPIFVLFFIYLFLPA